MNSSVKSLVPRVSEPPEPPAAALELELVLELEPPPALLEADELELELDPQAASTRAAIRVRTAAATRVVRRLRGRGAR